MTERLHFLQWTTFCQNSPSETPLRYELNQIPYNFAVKVTNRFKGLDLIDRVPEDLWMEVRNIVQEVVIKIIPKKKNARSQNGYLRRPYK